MARQEKLLGDFIFSILEKIDEAGGPEVIAKQIRTSLASAGGTASPTEPTGNQAVAASLANLIAQKFTVLPK